MRAKINEAINLQTDRLHLRNVRIDDVESLLKYAGEDSISDMMNGSIPKNYTQEVALQWLSKHVHDSARSQAISWAITFIETDVFIGSVQLRLDESRKTARLSYWLAKPYWNQGIATEANREIVRYGFEALELEKIQAEHFRRNPASGAVLRKIGFQHIGSICKKEGLSQRLEDFEQYLICAK
jgi:RimJ/RimL family protein N-acetyltransferase